MAFYGGHSIGGVVQEILEAPRGYGLLEFRRVAYIGGLRASKEILGVPIRPQVLLRGLSQGLARAFARSFAKASARALARGLVKRGISPVRLI